MVMFFPKCTKINRRLAYNASICLTRPQKTRALPKAAGSSRPSAPSSHSRFGKDVKSYGVSTLEMLLAVAIILLLAALAVINWGSAASNRRLQAGAQELAADLRYARQVAMNEGSAVLDVTVFPQGSTTGYTVRNNTGATIRQTTLQGLLVTLPGGAPSVSCTQSGTFSLGGSAILTDPKTNRTTTVTLVQRTGMVSVP